VPAGWRTSTRSCSIGSGAASSGSGRGTTRFSADERWVDSRLRAVIGAGRASAAAQRQRRAGVAWHPPEQRTEASDCVGFGLRGKGAPRTTMLMANMSPPRPTSPYAARKSKPRPAASSRRPKARTYEVLFTPSARAPEELT